MIESLFQGTDYWFSRFLIQRGLGLIYLLAFLNALNQFKPLAGENGLLPVTRFLRRVSFRKAPSLFHLHYSDRLFTGVAAAGALLSLAAFTGVSDLGPLWLSMTIWFLLWVLYLSIVNVGQVFYAFGWESMLLEAGFYAIFFGPLHSTAPVLVIWIFRWMLFRVEFGAGLIKMRGDECWRNLTCLNYHHQTQPLPNPLSRYFHMLPEPLHKVETFFNHLVQLVIVWGLFLPQPVASVSAALIILSQCYLIVSGNYSWLNWLTVILGFSGFSDGLLTGLTGLYPPEATPLPFPMQAAVLLLAVAVVILSYRPVKNMLSRNQMMNFSFNPIHLVNTYGAFGSVTKRRYEIVIEGTVEASVTPKTEWKAYEFRGKPGDPQKRSPQVSPYHLRLDWQMWFAAMSSPNRHPWLIRLMEKLLQNDRQTLKLLKNSPFGDSGPKHVRARLFEYRYTTRAERRESGDWWTRSFVYEYIRPLSREDIEPKGS